MAKAARPARVALVGPDSLIGREIREICGTSDSPLDLKQISDDEERDRRLDLESLENVRTVILAGSAASAREVLRAPPGPPIIDLTYASDDQPAVRLRAPLVEPSGCSHPAGAVHGVAHPAAACIALLLSRVHRQFPIGRSAIHILEPASERGGEGIEELQAQTVGLLSLKKLPRKVFDAQAAFNVLARYGEDAPTALEDVELRIERHLATLLASSPGVPMPSLCLLQAPVFHGYTFSVWVEFHKNPGAAALEDALAEPPVDVWRGELGPPSIAGIAGQSGVTVGGIRADRNQPRACWLWMVADNLRLRAESALAVARELL